MIAPRRICAVTTSRADYGLLNPLLHAIAAQPEFELRLAVTGSHLSPDHGHTIDMIERDGFVADARIEMLLSSDSGAGIAKAIALGTAGFADYLSARRPDMMILLGDRYEMLAAASAALVTRIPMAHLCGGDVTEGAFDEAIRHSLTKMAHLHFVTNARSAQRVIQLGEVPAHVFDVGSTGLDFIRTFVSTPRDELARALDLPAEKPWLLVTFHPVTLSATPSQDQLASLTEALATFGDDHAIIVTQPNADNEGRRLTALLREWVAATPHARFFESLGQQRYLSVMRHSAAVVGNSSSGLYEAPSFGVPTVNIGERQRGRLRATSVVDVTADAPAIVRAIRQVLQADHSAARNPYGDGHAAERIVRHLLATPDWPGLLAKPFHDLEL